MTAKQSSSVQVVTLSGSRYALYASGIKRGQSEGMLAVSANLRAATARVRSLYGEHMVHAEPIVALFDKLADEVDAQAKLCARDANTQLDSAAKMIEVEKNPKPGWFARFAIAWRAARQ